VLGWWINRGNHMLPFDGMSRGVTQKFIRWLPSYWDKPYDATPGTGWQCAHPLHHFIADMYHLRLPVADDITSSLLANWWYLECDDYPPSHVFLLLRFQQDDDAVDATHPDGIVHVEMLLKTNFEPEATEIGLSFGVGAGATFPNTDIHPFPVTGDSWYTPTAKRRAIRRYLNVDRVIDKYRRS